MVRVVYQKEEANCITHSGTMHADEVFATAFLDLYLKDVRVFRTNSISLDEVSEDVLVYDVGRGKFDHHQLDSLKRDNNIPYSSVGLLWKEFGKDFLKQNGFSNVDEMFIGIDKDMIEGIDGDDNGVFPKIDCSYKVKTLPNVIKIFNPSFDSYEDESEQFLKAVSLAKMIWEEELYYIQGKVIADMKLKDILEANNSSLKYLSLDQYLPYEEVVLSHPKGENLLYVLFPSNRGGYAIKALPKSLDDRTLRLPFPEEWAGLEGKKLEEVSGIPGLRFCHSSRFIINCQDFDCAMKVLELLCK